MSSLNKVMLIGFVGKDLDLKYTQQQKAFTSFSLATTESWKGKDGQKQEHTEWHNITVWGQLAEVCHKYIKKGSKVFVEGKIKTDCYEKDGEKKYTLKIQASQVIFLGSPAEKKPSSNYAPQGFPAPKKQHDPMDDIPF